MPSSRLPGKSRNAQGLDSSCQASMLTSIAGTSASRALDLGISRMGAPGVANPHSVWFKLRAQLHMSPSLLALCPPFRQPRGAGLRRKREVWPRACAHATWLVVVLGELVGSGVRLPRRHRSVRVLVMLQGGPGLCSILEKLERRPGQLLGMHLRCSRVWRKAGGRAGGRGSMRALGRLPHLAGHASFS